MVESQAILSQSPQGDQVDIVDVALSELIPLRKRTGKKLVFDRLESNIRAVGLFEPRF